MPFVKPPPNGHVQARIELSRELQVTAKTRTAARAGTARRLPVWADGDGRDVGPLGQGRDEQSAGPTAPRAVLRDDCLAGFDGTTGARQHHDRPAEPTAGQPRTDHVSSDDG